MWGLFGRGKRLRLALEAQQPLAIGREQRRQDFDRNVPFSRSSRAR
jgi:hypothetical protein